MPGLTSSGTATAAPKTTNKTPATAKQSFALGSSEWLLFIILYLVLFGVVAWYSLTQKNQNFLVKTSYFILLVVPAVIFFFAHVHTLFKTQSVTAATSVATGTNPKSTTNSQNKTWGQYMESAHVIAQLAILVALVGIIFVAMWFIENFPLAITAGVVVGGIALLIVGLAIVYETLRHLRIHVSSRSGISHLGLMMKIIFYLPCLFLDMLSAVQRELQITTPTVWTAIVIEVGLLLAVLYYPWVLKRVLQQGRDGVNLVNEPLYLNDKQVRANIYGVASKKSLGEGLPATYPTEFAICAWIFINPQSSSHPAYTSYANIFRFGSQPGGKPMITYYNRKSDSAPGQGTYRIFYLDASSTAGASPPYVEVQVPVSRWTHFVFNYTHLQFDLFVDGKLIATKPFGENDAQRVTFSDRDVFVVGQKDGLDGAICNVVYTPYALSQQNILTQYNLLKDASPPIAVVTE